MQGDYIKVEINITIDLITQNIIYSLTFKSKWNMFHGAAILNIVNIVGNTVLREA